MINFIIFSNGSWPKNIHSVSDYSSADVEGSCFDSIDESKKRLL